MMRECWPEGLPFCSTSSRQPGTFVSMSDLIFSRSIRACLSNLNQRGIPDCRVVRGLEIVLAEGGDNELTRFGGIKVARALFPCELLLVDLFLQHQKCVNQGLRARRATWNVDVHWDVPVDALENVVALLEGAA